jgi:hypothetical protein
MRHPLLVTVTSLVIVGCSATPHTGEDITMASTPSGLNVVQSSSRSVLPSGGLAGEEAVLSQLKATVDSVDHRSRSLTLRSADDRTVTLKVGPEVRNFSQIQKGDTVEIDYFEAVAFEVRQPTQEERELAGVTVDIAMAAEKGAKPAAILGGERVDILTVAGIDLKKEAITLNGPNGPVTVKAKYPENLKVVKVGDTVVVKTSELLAAGIRKTA